MRIRKTILSGLVAATAVALLAFGVVNSRCPIEISVVSSEPIDVIDEAGENLRLVTIRVENTAAARVEFGKDAKVEARVGNRWAEVPDLWALRNVAARGGAVRYLPEQPADQTLLLPERADACRFQLRYRLLGVPRLPLGIRNSEARQEAPSLISLRAQQVTARISPGLYDWLWPLNPPPPTYQERWRSTVVELELPPTTRAGEPKL